jgi:3-oxoacid CoA-transferase subunit B
MEHTTKDARPKILKMCALPLTGAGVVNTIITELAYIDVTPVGLVLKEIAPDTTAEIVQSLTEPALRIDPNLRRFPV